MSAAILGPRDSRTPPSARIAWTPGRVWNDGARRPAMIDLPMGIYRMGEHPDDKFANDTERPAHQVDIGYPLALGRFPVTVAEFAEFRGTGHSAEAADLPVAGANWDDATAYCAWLRGTTGRAYRLPSESEWEYAAAAGSRHPFPNGDVITPADANFYYDEQGNRIGLGRLTPVGSYAPNAFGLCDMIGNVCEWVADAWHPTLRQAPAEGESWADATDLRVLRGGAWDYLPRLLRISWRDYLPRATRRDNVGFRVACDLLER
ncbi:MAG: SUMF1/EgtB/PvdO family nonheme iron enzyme [Terrimicrobiaceae bacterium]|nr:SUMF1/EgtB/PvdO family nonheme iron enzyme [Terrimicrobiaceae bacterium]